MDYKKPQDTLVHGGIGLYPLTTADQVILADGGRLEKAGKINADKLDGRTLAEIMLALYPVGAVYISANSTSPASLFGGSWTQIKGRFLLATGEVDQNSDTYFGQVTGGWNAVVGSTGGQDYHKLTINEIPSHDHNLIRQQWYSADQVHSSASYSIFSWKTEEGGSTSSSYNGKVEATGGDNVHNNMPPYLAVYMWKRVS